MTYEVCAVILTIIFAMLAYSIIRTLQATQRSLKNINQLTLEVDSKMKLLDSTFKTVAHLSDVAEAKTKRLLSEETEVAMPPRMYVTPPHRDIYNEELTEIFLSGLKLAIKYLRRK